MKLLCGVAFFSISLFAADDVASAVVATVKTVDRGTKVVVVKTADGTEETFHIIGRGIVHGAAATGKGAGDVFDTLKDGDEVVVHYTVKGAEKTGVEFDRVGRDGLHVVEGTAKTIDRGAKTITVKAADGTEQTFHFTKQLGKEAGEGAVRGTEKAGKVTVYYTEDAGRKIAHFFKSS